VAERVTNAQHRYEMIAPRREIIPEGRGREDVRGTRASKFLSKMSLIGR
jgi:hypothetical protein